MRTLCRAPWPIRIACFSAMSLTASACNLKPRLAPEAVGCYAVAVDSFPDVYRRMLVPPPPPMVRLDTLMGPHVQVPRAWLEADRLGVRRSGLGLGRPYQTIRNGVVVNPEGRGSELPRDSIRISFGANGPSMTALLQADGHGNWSGMAYVLSAATPRGQPFVHLTLTRQDCPAIPMARS
jgi:hypothetical protein